MGLTERFNVQDTENGASKACKHLWFAEGPILVWAYRNTLHESTAEKPSFLLFGRDCHSPTEAALLPFPIAREQSTDGISLKC